MSLKIVSHLIIWPALAAVGGILLLTPKDILRQPILSADASSSVSQRGEAALIPATLTVRATALAPASAPPRNALAVATVTPPSAPAPALSAPPADRRWTTARSLNLRSGPSVNARLVASLPFGTPVEVIEASGSWVRIDAGGASGWLSANFLSTTSPDAQ